jgi:dihydrofolate synthase / folylpolyglutamate synthase
VADPLSYLFGLEQFGIKFGLDNIFAIVDGLGHPERAFQSIHIAGTNGKGSVTAMVDAALRAAGHRSARYTSPHLIDLRERFVIDGRPVDADMLTAAVAHVRDAVETLRRDGVLVAQPTFFEVTTAVAFELFRKARVETAVLEVGLGGRLDATNVVVPIVSAITSIALDHQRYLGSTLPQIATEKGGIIKTGVPVVVGEMDALALAAIEAVAGERRAPVVRAWEGVSVTPVGLADDAEASVVRLQTPAHDYGEVAVGLRGAHQVGNAVVAVRVLEMLDGKGLAVPPEAVRAGLSRPDWPGRLDLRRLPDGRELLLDAAHNPAGATALASYLQTWSTRPLPLVFAAMRDKDTEGMLRALLPAVSRVVFTSASNARSSDPRALAAQAQQIMPEVVCTIAASPAAALADAWLGSPRIVVAGSIFLLGDVCKEIGG